MPAREFNFDGLVGPTHHYAGLSFGNLASMENRHRASNPRAAALQGLEKMKLLADLGVAQAVLPPHERPHLPTLRKHGYTGTDQQIIERVAKDDPALLSIVSSASSMWAANAATVSPSADCKDGKVHFTPANLVSQVHRSIEAAQTSRVLKRIFPQTSGRFVHHDPLPAELADEGAANHTRLCATHASSGFEIFTFGRSRFDSNHLATTLPARQTHEASIAIARLHALDSDRVLFMRQSAAAINAGAFHNDVVAVGNERTLLYHSQAFADGAIDHLTRRMQTKTPDPFDVGDERVGSPLFHSLDAPLSDAIRSYVFNSQLVLLPDGTQTLIAPMHAKEVESSHRFVKDLLARRVIDSVHFVDLRQSMQNGGGPACLRLRVVLTDEEASQVHPGVIWNQPLHEKLVAWVNRRYRESLTVVELADPLLLRESRDALDEVNQILLMDSLYEFQH